MTPAGGLPRRFRFTWRGWRQIGREVDDELSFHLERQVDDLRAEGLFEAEARREAGRRFGDLERARKSLKAAGRRRERYRRRQLMLDDFVRDLRYACRSLLRSPGFAATAVLVLTLGIGINSAIFSVVNLMIMRPIMIEDPEQLVGVYSQDTEKPDNFRAFSYPTYLDIRDQNDVFTELAAFNITFAGLAEGDTTRRVMAGVVSANFFDTLGVPISSGRGFNRREEAPGGDSAVAVVSHQFATRHGGGVLGSNLKMNGHSVTVVGVAPDGFTGTTALFSPDLWLPLGLYESIASMPGSSGTLDLDDRNTQQLMLFGRLRPDLRPQQAAPQLAALASRLEAAYPTAHKNQTFMLSSLPRLSISTAPADETGLVAPVLLIMAMGGIVLLIACLNLANMFLARGANRRVELAIRLSLGGGRLRLLRQLLCEGLVLSLAGGAAGLLLAAWGTRWLLSSITELIPFGMNLLVDARPDLRVFAATLAFCLLATFLAGLGPAWKLASGDVLAGLKETAGQSLSGGGQKRLAPRNLLVVAQIALSLTLLSAGGLFMRGAFSAADQTPGFALENSLLAELDTSLLGYDEVRGRETYRQLLERLRAMPGVEAASMASIVPFGSVTNMRRVLPAGQSDEDLAARAHQYIVGDDYFTALGLPILRGRDFTPAEASSASTSQVAIIDEPLAKLLWPDSERPGEQALGQSLRLLSRQPNAEPTVLEIVAVVPGLRHRFWDHQPAPHLYLPHGQLFAANMFIHLRLDSAMGDAEDRMLGLVRQEIRSLDDRLPVLGLKTLRDHRDQSLFLWAVKAAAKFFSILGLLALFLALVGVYGVKAFVVARRTREIGLRMALGATPAKVMKQMVAEGLGITLAGLGLGLVLSILTAKLLSALIYQSSSGASLILITTATLLATTATLASYIPARRATRIQPTEALRQD